ncbi:MAG: exonuclease domain-containing protein [Pirellula sp.]|jgi:DNA polymerase-3 subunit epsilon|nr:exonuclease domain-containing protein [Pirellula sp.]
MNLDRIAVIDVETTGLSPWRHDRIVEIGIVVMDTAGSIELEYETLVNPLRDIGPSGIHRISSEEVLKAPSFADVAGDVLEILTGCSIVAGHNVSFDRNFLIKEYDRLGVILPETPTLCTCRLQGRSSLESCCRDLGIAIDGLPHRALFDAQLTARIVASLLSEDSALTDTYRISNITWPSITPLRTPCFTRSHAAKLQAEPPRFLQRIGSRIRHDVDAVDANVLAYMVLIDRILEDRVIDQDEENVLVDAISNWGLSNAQLAAAHTNYLQKLAVAALADGFVSDTERRDLHLVARLLGRDQESLDVILESAANQLSAAKLVTTSSSKGTDLRGKSVCFTGQLDATLRGQPISRDIAETLAEKAGLTIASGVTKKLDLLVVADPNTQSGKAKKAREYGTRILADAVFWPMAGIAVD